MSLGTAVEGAIRSLPVPLVYAVVFLLPAAEASLFFGFIIPGETAVVIGGYLAYAGYIDLPLCLAVAIAGAIIGDSIGYAIGSRYGQRLLATRVGHFVGRRRWAVAERFLHRYGGAAVFLGRYTALLRALIPAAAGTARIPYRKFLLWNVLGGTCWATCFVLLGYFGGTAYHKIEQMIGRASWIILLVVAVVAIVLHRRSD